MSSGYNAESEAAAGCGGAANRNQAWNEHGYHAAGGVCTQRVEPIVAGISQLMEGRRVMLVSSGRWDWEEACWDCTLRA